MRESITDSRLRVLLVDGHDLYRTGLAALLGEHGLLVAATDSVEAALRRLRLFPADVIVMEMHLPGTCGAVSIARVIEHAPDARVLMLTVATDEELVMNALLAGASGYLLKDTKFSDIVAGIRAAGAGHSPVAPRVASALIDRLRACGNTRSEAGPAGLSERDRQVLALMADGRDNAEIAQRLFVSPSTVKSDSSRLFAKLGVANRVQAAVYATRHNLLDVRSTGPSVTGRSVG